LATTSIDEPYAICQTSTIRYYQIGPDEFQKLRAWQKQLLTEEKKSVDQTHGGAGASSVVLSTERFTPSEGRLVQQKTLKAKKE
jgi:hypothetical protein